MSTLTNVQQGQENELEALKHIYRFGWHRPQEIGRYIWPGSKHSEMYGVRIGLKLQKARMVIARKLPSHHGTALLLSKRGAERLRQMGIDASSSKDIGTTVDGVWTPRQTWEHDLLCTSFLILVREKFQHLKYEFHSELEISRAYPNALKVPDGFIHNDDGKAFWVEVENRKKSGKDMTAMIQSAIKVARFGEVLFNKNCKDVVFAYPEFTENYLGHQVNHRTRLISAIEKILKPGFSMKVSLFKIKQKSCAAVSFEIEMLILESDEAKQKAKNLVKIYTDEETKSVYYQTDLKFHTGCVEPNGREFNWSLYLDRSEHNVPDDVREFHEVGIASSLTNAKIAIVNAVERAKTQ